MKKLILAILAAFVFGALPPATAEAAQASDTQQALAARKGKVNSRTATVKQARKLKKKKQKKKQKRQQKRDARKAARKARKAA